MPVTVLRTETTNNKGYPSLTVRQISDGTWTVSVNDNAPFQNGVGGIQKDLRGMPPNLTPDEITAFVDAAPPLYGVVGLSPLTVKASSLSVALTNLVGAIGNYWKRELLQVTPMVNHSIRLQTSINAIKRRFGLPT